MKIINANHVLKYTLYGKNNENDLSEKVLGAKPQSLQLQSNMVMFWNIVYKFFSSLNQHSFQIFARCQWNCTKDNKKIKLQNFWGQGKEIRIINIFCL